MYFQGEKSARQTIGEEANSKDCVCFWKSEVGN